MSPKYRKTLNFFSLSALACSQIWLIPLVDDSQCGYENKIEKEKRKKKERNYLEHTSLLGIIH
jgi:hypothetical protein